MILLNCNILTFFFMYSYYGSFHNQVENFTTVSFTTGQKIILKIAFK